MSTLVAQHPRHRLGRGSASQHGPAQAPSAAHLIAWRMEGDGVWVGRLDHLLDAGVVRRTPAGYAVEAWDGAPEGVFATLAAAQLSLEPAYRAWLREQDEPRHRGTLGTALTLGGLAAVAVAAVAGLLAAFPL
jgi:hypothetical protein